MKDVEGKLSSTQGKQKSKMRPEHANFSLMAHVLSVYEPSTFEEERKEKKWNATIDTKIKELQMNRTWDLVKLPKGEKVISYRWVYKI